MNYDNIKYEYVDIDEISYVLSECKEFDEDFGFYFCIELENLNKNLLEFIVHKRIIALGLSFSTEIRDVEFLNSDYFNQIEHLNIVGNSIENIDALKYLTNLKSLRFTGTFLYPFDFSRIEHLKILCILYNQNFTNGISKCLNLEHLEVHHYKSKDKTLKDFSTLTKLKTLHFSQSTIYNLDGLENLNNLESLSLRYLRNVSSLKPLEHKKNIESLFIQNAKKIIDWEIIGTMSKLKKLKIDSCGIISNLNFIKNLNLQEIEIINTKIEEDCKWLTIKFQKASIRLHGV